MIRKTLLSPVLTLFLPFVIMQAHAEEPDYKRRLIDQGIPGAAFVVEGDVRRGRRPELIVSGFGPVEIGPMGPVISDAGTVSVYSGAIRGYSQTKEKSRAKKYVVVGEEELITFPNRPTPADVNQDRRQDIIIPGGYFFDTFIGQARGSLTWWENKRNGTQWVRHDVGTGSPCS